LQAIYDAAKLGLKGDTLALASGMRPEEYRHLCQFDALAEMAAIKGKADGEREMADILHKAAREGDAKAALEILKHQHGWVAKQSITVDIDQRISITQALQEAEMRVVDVVASAAPGIEVESPQVGWLLPSLPRTWSVKPGCAPNLIVKRATELYNLPEKINSNAHLKP
jgi:hypothetical protein